jgi:hypothetical protein
MTKRRFWGLFIIGLLVAALPAVFQHAPGYTDADYYYATGLRVVNGKGMTEPFLWHFLGDFPSIVHPSHSFWMPLSTWIAAGGMTAAGAETFWAAKWPFLILTGLIPVLTAKLTWRLTDQVYPSALAGWLACFSGFYLPYLAGTDSFSPAMVLGAGYLLLLLGKNGWRTGFGLGLICGAVHLARAEGLIWIVFAAAALGWQKEGRVSSLAGLLTGYLFLAGPWIIRNYLVFGSLLGKAGLQTLWLTDYDQLFAYPANQVNFETWWDQGWREIIKDRWWALKINMQTAFVVQGQIYLWPLVLWGAGTLWNRRSVRVAAAGWVGLLGIMTVLFPFPGARGSFFHGGAMLQPLFWGLAAVGLNKLIGWGGRQRSWDTQQARKVLGAGLVVISGMLSLFITWDRVVGENLAEPAWNSVHTRYLAVEEALSEIGAEKSAAVLVNNPPGYYAANLRKAAAVPSGGPASVLRAAEDYQVNYLLLDENYPSEMEDYYLEPESQPGWLFKGSAAGIRIYQFVGPDS